MGSTSWERVGDWYGGLVGKEGHLYHKEVILPSLLPLLELTPHASLLDLGCGQGFLVSSLPKKVEYQGVDLSKSLIAQAKTLHPDRSFLVADVTKPFQLEGKKFSHATFILSLQNMERPDLALLEASSHLQEGGTLVIVMNHPCFRIPRQSSWGVDDSKKLEYRRIDRYLSPLKIPIDMAPGKGEKKTTWSFHFPLSSYSKFLYEAGFATLLMEEWTSHKTSTGKAAKMENRARSEFPLFLTIKAMKVN